MCIENIQYLAYPGNSVVLIVKITVTVFSNTEGSISLEPLQEHV